MFCNCGGTTKAYKVTRDGFALEGSECRACGRRSLLQSDFDAAYDAHCAGLEAQAQGALALEPTNSN
jgi:hypothetical protein